ncbi:unnamed protein product [Mytilus edulis]|uniref:Uncharacterized protein n=1 Tax=Mytilus edulis TaxID=6550 RepID=A0A8S3QAK7_MYTED|nr:unnamed protein product [Mytilus edulis]
MSLAGGKYETKRKIDIEVERSESDTHSTEKKRQRTGSPIETEQEIHKQDQEPQKTEQQASTPPLTDSRQSDSSSNENGEIMLIQEEASTSAQTPQENISTTEEVLYQRPVRDNFPVSINLRRQLDIRTNANHLIYSCIKIGKTLVFAVFQTHQLIICNVNGTDIHHIPLAYFPHYITEVDSNTVAVSCTNTEVYIDSQICLINMSTRSVTRKITISDECRGISYDDNNLYVVIARKRIQVMDLTGKEIRTIPLPTPDISDITVDRHRLVCINNTSIYYFSLDGTLMWEFKNDRYQLLHRVTTDADGNVYATDYNTHTVVAVSADKQQSEELITKSDGLNEPFAIYFEKKNNVLLVCNHKGGRGFLFDANNDQN